MASMISVAAGSRSARIHPNMGGNKVKTNFREPAIHSEISKTSGVRKGVSLRGSPETQRRIRVRELEEEMARIISSSSGPNLKAMFDIIDDDDSGYIDQLELQRLLERNNVQIKELSDLDDLFAMYDTSGNGKISESEFAQRYRLDRDTFMGFLEVREDQNDKCASLPVTVLFFIVYAVLILLHEDTSRVFGLDHGVKNYFTEITQTKSELKFADLETVGDVWEWMGEGFVPSVTASGASDTDFRVARYTVIVGSGLVFKQSRATSKTDDWWNPCNDIYDNPCHASYEQSSDAYGLPQCGAKDTANCVVTEQTLKDMVTEQVSGPHPLLSSQGNAVIAQKQFDASKEAFEPCDKGQGGYCFTLNTKDGRQDLSSQLQALKHRGWIDLYTKKVQINMYLYNGDLGVYTSVVIVLEFNDGGEVQATYNSRSIVSDPYGGVKVVLFVLDAVWILMVISLGITEAKEMIEATKESDKKTCCARYLTYWEDKWNYLDWSQIVLALTVQIMWLKMYIDINFFVTNKLRDINSPNTTTVGDPEYVTDYENVYNQLTATLEQAGAYRSIATFNLFVLVIRFFKAFGGQPKLAKISSTISMAAVDIIHHMIIMSILFLSFMFAGMFLFGHHVKAWGDIWSAVITTLSIWFSAEMEWEDMYNTNPGMAVVWYCSYILLMVFIVLNLFLAIIIGGYSDAKDQLATGETTLWTQVGNFVKQAVANKQGSITLEYVMELVKGEDGAEDAAVAGEEEFDTDSITIAFILETWYKDDTQHNGKNDKDKAREISRDFMQALVSDFMYYRKQLRKQEEDTQKQVMYNRIRDMDYHFQQLHEKIDKLERKLAGDREPGPLSPKALER